MYNMNHSSKYGKMIVSFILITIIYVLAFYGLWNWLMPKIFGLPKIDMWEAIGLLLLFKIIFGFSFKSSHSRNMCNHKQDGFLKSKMENMTDEEKEMCKNKLKNWCNRTDDSFPD